MYYVYILLCDNEMFYTGYTENIPRRLREHRNGRSTYTSRFTEIQLVYFEMHRSRAMAMKRERYIKKRGRRYRERLIEAFEEANKEVERL